jgi:hypothetical protein
MKYTPMRYMPVKCTPMKCTPMRCTPIRYAPVRCGKSGVGGDEWEVSSVRNVVVLSRQVCWCHKAVMLQGRGPKSSFHTLIFFTTLRGCGHTPK